MPDFITTEQLDKIGNAIVYLSKRVSELNQTKVLKLLFLLEEKSIQKYGHPFFGVDFKVWVRGPVLEEVFYDLEKESPVVFAKYIKRAAYNKDLFVANKDFDDGEFSQNDIKLMDEVSEFARHKIAGDLVRHTHRDASLWARSAKKYGVYDDLVQEKITTTNHSIDFSFLVEDNEYLKERYADAVQNLEFRKALKK
jgi:uncharacterized phage-associated protein